MTYLQNVTMIIFQSLWKNLFRIIFIDFFKKKWRSKHNMQMRKRNAYILQKFRKKICLLAYSAVVHSHSVFFYNYSLQNFWFAVFWGKLFSNTRRKRRCKIILLHIEKDEHWYTKSKVTTSIRIVEGIINFIDHKIY